MDNFAPDFGLALMEGKFSNLKHITLTAVAFQGMPVRECDGSTELTMEIMGYVGSIVVPLSLKEIAAMLAADELIPLVITGTGDVCTSSCGEEFVLVNAVVGNS